MPEAPTLFSQIVEIFTAIGMTLAGLGAIANLVMRAQDRRLIQKTAEDVAEVKHQTNSVSERLETDAIARGVAQEQTRVALEKAAQERGALAEKTRAALEAGVLQRGKEEGAAAISVPAIVSIVPETPEGEPGVAPSPEAPKP